ncbi:MAG: DUF2322 family protein [Gammaproteobacteria bacterium]
MSNQKNFGADFNNLLDTSHLKSITLSDMSSGTSFRVDNIPGKQASVKILYAISQANDFKISRDQARTGVSLFGDYAEEEKQQPGAHPNIKLLFDIIENNQVWMVEVS